MHAKIKIFMFYPAKGACMKQLQFSIFNGNIFANFN